MRIKLLSILTTFLMLSSCKLIYSHTAIDSYWLNKIVYTRHGIHFQDRVYSTANFLKGPGYIPEGQELTVIYVTDDKATVLYNRIKIDIKNSEWNSDKNIDELLLELFTEEKFEPLKFPDFFQKSASVGMPMLGMTKKQIRHCCGPPPKGFNPDLRSDRWIYWMDQFEKVELKFFEDILIDISKPKTSINIKFY